jgi:signal recognition particle receptor subunit beta
MVSINYSAREVCCKIVYYGPGLSGKTTNLQYVHAKVPGNTRGKLISLATEADRTLYFDFLPINIGTINGFAAKFQLYTVPGQVYYNATRKLVLRGVDGIVFVADSQPSKMDENIESLTNLEENLREYGYDIDDIPLLIQYNKRDLPGVLTVEELQKQLNPKGRPYHEASATIGNGVFDTLKAIIKLVLDKAKNSSAAKARPITTIEPNEPIAAEPQPVTEPAETPMSSETPAPESAEAPAEQPTETPPSEPVYRPYPGSDAHDGTATSTAVKPATVPRPMPGDDPGPARKVVTDTRSDAPAGGSTPRMAPPLRRNKDKKKRGFFKRLFGVK